MNENELANIWKSYDQKLEQVLVLNKQLTMDLTKEKLNRTIVKLRRPKRNILFLGIPFTILLCFVTYVGFMSGGIFVTLGFGSISLIMITVIVLYFYHLYLINGIDNDENVHDVQRKLSKLKLSSYNVTRISILQLPFWSICWMSWDALQDSILLYGGVNLIVFLGLGYLAFRIYRSFDIHNLDSKVNKFFFSGSEWDPIIKSSQILDQLKEFKINKF